jgi:hypothetical protein
MEDYTKINMLMCEVADLKKRVERLERARRPRRKPIQRKKKVE